MALTKVKLIADGTIVQSNLHASHGITTADIGENASYLYYTDARARAAVSVSGNALSYNSSTGVITSNFEESPVFTGNVELGDYSNVSMSASSAGQLKIYGNAYQGAIALDATGMHVYHNSSSRKLILGTNETARLTIEGTGEVGIGTDSPASKLHVNGASGTADLFAIGDAAIPTSGSEYGVAMIKTNSTEFALNVTAYNANSQGARFYSHGAQTIFLVTSGLYGDVFKIAGGGKVLINQTSSATTAHLQVDGYVDITKNPVGAFRLYDGTTFKGGLGDGQWAFGSTSNVNDLALYAQNDLLFHAGSGNSIDMMIDATTHNVGIGTTTPNAALTVVDNSDGSSTPLVVASGDGAFAINQEVRINFAQGPGSSFSNSASLGHLAFAYTGGSFQSAFIVKTNTTSSSDQSEKMRVTANGNVGIGATSPAYKLDVNGGIQLNGKSALTNNGYFIGAPSYGFRWNNNADTFNNVIMYDNGNMYVRGSVGIGTTSPQALLHVHDPDTTYTNYGTVFLGTTAGGSTGESGISLMTTGDALAGFVGSNLTIDGTTYSQTNASRSSGYINFVNTTTAGRTSYIIFGGTVKGSTTLTERMRINDDGYVGIGTNNPQEKLHVAGRTITGSSTDYASLNGGFSTSTTTRENGGVVTLVSNGEYRYYERVCQISTGSGSAGYWHIKTNINWSNSFVMYMAKFYGYIYGQAAIMDITVAGYAYTSGPISTNVINNSTNSSSVATYASTDGKLVFRVDLAGSTYYAGLWMDIGFQNPTGGALDFEILAQGFNTGTTYY